MARVLVTGAGGFTGRHLGPALAARGYEAHGLVNCHDGDMLPGYLTVHEADLTDATSVRQAVATSNPEYVVHLAGIAFVGHNDVEEMYAVNIIGTRHLLDALSNLPSKPRSVLLASSANVYGNGTEGKLDESAQFAPANDYGVTKVAMECVSSIFSSELPMIVVRPFNYTGRGQSPSFIVPKIVQHARECRRVIELGNTKVRRDISDVRTVVDAYIRLLEEPKAIGQTFNVCSGRTISIEQIIELVSACAGHQFDVRVDPAFVRSNEIPTLQGNKSKIGQTIGPLRDFSFKETVRWMLEE